MSTPSSVLDRLVQYVAAWLLDAALEFASPRPAGQAPAVEGA
jgi:hypothetical protein